MQEKSADTLTVKQLLSLALDWIEARASFGDTEEIAPLEHRLTECEPLCRAVCRATPPEQAIELRGPANTYPLVIGLTLLSAMSGKPWGFIAQPWTWSDEDWQKITNAVAKLHCRPISYRTGFQRVSIVYQLTA